MKTQTGSLRSTIGSSEYSCECNDRTMESRRRKTVTLLILIGSWTTPSTTFSLTNSKTLLVIFGSCGLLYLLLQTEKLRANEEEKTSCEGLCRNQRRMEPAVTPIVSRLAPVASANTSHWESLLN